MYTECRTCGRTHRTDRAHTCPPPWPEREKAAAEERRRRTYGTLPDELVEEARSLGETRDCTVKALAILCGVPYRDAHAAMELCGRRPGRGATHDKQEAAYHLLGFELVPVCSWRHSLRGVRYCNLDAPAWAKASRTVRTLGRHLPAEGAYLVKTSGHALAAKDGMVLDHTEGRCARVRTIYRVVRKGEA